MELSPRNISTSGIVQECSKTSKYALPSVYYTSIHIVHNTIVEVHNFTLPVEMDDVFYPQTT